MNQEIITLTKVFKDLNLVGNDSLFKIDGEEVIPLTNRVKLILLDSLLNQKGKSSFSNLLFKDPFDVSKEELARSIEKDFEGFPKGFVFVHNPTYYDGGYLKHSNDTAIREFSRKFSDETKICLQQNNREFPPRSSMVISTEELGELIAMLYFREKGYVVQNPRRTYGKEGDDRPGVDDVVTWKSPVVDKLREHGFIGKGCHMGELAFLRWLGKVSTSGIRSGHSISKEIVLVEVEHSEAEATSNSASKGINQLLRAKKGKVAKELFICFPFVNKDAEEVFAEIRRETKEESSVGAILFDSKGLHIHDSETFPDNNVVAEIHQYENNLKKALLNNFYFDEIVEMIKELDVDTKNKGFKEVKEEFYGRIELDYVLEKLNNLI